MNTTNSRALMTIKEGKEKLISQIAAIGRKYRTFKYPILLLAVPLLLFYNLACYSCKYFKAKERMAKAVATAMCVILCVTSTDIAAFASTGDAGEAAVKTDGFSCYTVEFTYNELQYVLEGDERVELTTILDAVGIKENGEITAVEGSNDELFKPVFEDDVWYIEAVKAFSSEEWLKVTIDGIEYEIVVTDFADTEYAAYVVPYDNSDRPISGTYEYWRSGWGTSEGKPITVEYDGVKQVVDSETRYYYKTIGMAINAAKAGDTNAEYYDVTSNPNGVFVAGTGEVGDKGNDYLSEHIGQCTDKVVLLKDATDTNDTNSLWNFGQYWNPNVNGIGGNPWEVCNDKYGIQKGIIIDMNGYDATILAPGTIPENQVLVVMNSSSNTSMLGKGSNTTDAVDDENGTGYCEGTVVLSNIYMNGKLWAGNHHYILLDGYYNTTDINKENAQAAGKAAGNIEPRGGYYIYDPSTSKFDLQFGEAHIESGTFSKDSVTYTYSVCKGGIVYGAVTLDTNATDTVKKDGETYTGETLSGSHKYGDEITLPTLTRDGYYFAGWAKSGDAVESEYFETASGLSTTQGADVTLYAVWISNTTEFVAAISGNHSGGVYFESDNVTKYTTLQSACNNSVYTDEIELLANVTENITIPSGKFVTVDLNGFVINSNNSSRTITVDGGLTIKDSGTDKINYFKYIANDGWTYLSDHVDDGNEVALADMASATLTSGSTVIAVPGGCITGKGVNVNGTFTVNGGNIVGNSKLDDNNPPADGGGVTVLNGTFTMNGGNIIGNRGKYGGGVSVSNGATFNANNVNISYNYAYEEGGGISANGAFHLTGGTVSYNVAKTNGGAIHTWSNAKAVSSDINGCDISYNSAGSAGGAIHLVKGDKGHALTIIDSEITNNKSGGNGGGIDTEWTLTLGGETVISNNKKGDTIQNVYLPSEKTIAIGTPAAGMSVGVTLASGTGNVTTANTGQYAQYFSSDNVSYQAFAKDNVVYIAAPTGTGDVLNVNKGNKYETIADAISDATEGDAIRLLGNITENVTVNKSITLDLNGNVLKGTGSESVVTINSGKSLYLQDSNPTEEHFYSYSKNGAWTLNTSANEGITINEINDSTDDGAVISVPGGAITGGNQSNGGGVSNYGSFTMTNGNIIGNKASQYGGAIYASGDVTINANIIGNEGTHSGGGIYIYWYLHHEWRICKL